MSDRNGRRQYSDADTTSTYEPGKFESTHLNVPAGMRQFKPSKTKHRLRVFPYTTGVHNPAVKGKAGLLHYELSYLAHRGINGTPGIYICLETRQQRCPVCEHRQHLRNKGSDDEELLKTLRNKGRQLFIVQDLDDTEDRSLQYMDMAYSLFGQQLKTSLDERDKRDPEQKDWANFHHIEGGFDLTTKWKKKAIGKTEFFECVDIEYVRRQKPLLDKYLDKVPNLEDMLKVMSYKDLKAVLAEESEEDNDGDDEDAPKSKKKPAGKPTKKPVDEDEDEDEDAETDEEDEDEAPPAKKPAAKKKPAPSDDEDEDEDEEEDDTSWDEDEDEAPAPKKKRK